MGKTPTKLIEPETITRMYLEVVYMPNGELICLGKTVGRFDKLGEYLKVADEADTAINSHDELVEALKIADEAICKTTDFKECDSDLMIVVNCIREALRKAGVK